MFLYFTKYKKIEDKKSAILNNFNCGPFFIKVIYKVLTS